MAVFNCEITEKDWLIYYKVRRSRVLWDIAGYCGWDIKDLTQGCQYLHEDYNYSKYVTDDVNIHLAESEMLFIAEYVEEYFDINTNIFELIDTAYSIAMKIRKDELSMSEYGDLTMKIITRTIYLDRYMPEEWKKKKEEMI